VLRLAARGLTTHDIAGRLYISPKTADHHIQHIDGKIRRVDAGRGGSLGDAVSPVRTDSSPRALQVIRCDVLGGLIHEYEIAAEA
jgi:hypothetical protein